jgi:hypothetical protein
MKLRRGSISSGGTVGRCAAVCAFRNKQNFINATPLNSLKRLSILRVESSMKKMTMKRSRPLGVLPDR